MFRFSFLTPLLAFFLIAIGTNAGAQEAAPHVKVRLVPERNTIEKGEGIWVLLDQTIEPGWHTYWVNPGDSGAAPRLTWKLPDGFTTQDISWPTPHKVTIEGLVSYGYEGHVALGQMLLAPDKLPAGKLDFELKAEILVCKDICIPETSTLNFTLNDPAAKPEDHGDEVDAFVNTLPMKTEWTGTFKNEGADFVVHIKHELPGELGDAKPDSFEFMPMEWGLVKNAAPASVTFTSPQDVVLRQTHDDRDLSKVGPFDAIVVYKTFDGHERPHTVSLKPEASISPAPSTVAPTPAPPGDIKKNSEPRPIAGHDTTLIEAIAFALLGGLILNLMPCVFPVLSIKALSLIKLREKGWGASAASGLAYTAGVLLSFAAIGGLLMSVKIAGGDIGWGFQLQNPAIVLALGYLLFIIGLNLSGLFDISGTFTGIGSRLSSRSGVSGSFFTGVLATLVATPCTAPFMAGALGFALIQPAPVAMVIFMALGLGLSLPYLMLSVIPSLAALLPRPGLWMVKFRELLAFPVYASAAWLIWVLSMQAGTDGLMWALAGMVAIAFGLWLLMHKPVQKTRRGVIIVLALTAFVFAGMPFIDTTILYPKTKIEAQHAADAYTPEKLETLLKANDPVFVYMTASWCITCKVNEKIAINTAATQALFKTKNVRVLEGDWTNMNADITNFLKSYGRSGVPLYVFYGAPDGAGTRPVPVVLPQVLTNGIIQQTIGD